MADKFQIWRIIRHIAGLVKFPRRIHDLFVKMITAEQIRAARALLRWTAHDLAENSGVSWRTIQRLEAATGVPASRSKNLEIIQRTLEHAGVTFIAQNGGGPGVRLKNSIEPDDR